MSIADLRNKLNSLKETAKLDPYQFESKTRNQIDAMIRSAKQQIPMVEGQIFDLIRQESTAIVFTKTATDLRQDLVDDFINNRGDNVFGVDYLYPEKSLMRLAWGENGPADGKYKFGPDFRKHSSNWAVIMAGEINAVEMPQLEVVPRTQNVTSNGYEHALESIVLATRKTYDNQLANAYVDSVFLRNVSRNPNFTADKAVAIVYNMLPSELDLLALTAKKVAISTDRDGLPPKTSIVIDSDTTTEGLLSAISKLSGKKKQVKKEE
jgi:hypothetical protein